MTGPSSWGLGNTNPLATRGPTLGLGSTSSISGEPERGYLFPIRDVPLGGVRVLQLKRGLDVVYEASGARLFIIEAKSDPKLAPRLQPAGQVVLFQKIMEDWGFNDQDAATLLGFEAASDIHEIYVGAKPVGHRDANDRLRAVLRIATDLHDLFRKVTAIREWLSEPQRDLGSVPPRSLLTEGSMENLLRVKYYAAYLSGR